tara:strand:+ start:5174 stop:5353 length:180 start_codon:yes stop_codon:yes gene_type:complete
MLRGEKATSQEETGVETCKKAGAGGKRGREAKFAVSERSRCSGEVVGTMLKSSRTKAVI